MTTAWRGCVEHDRAGELDLAHRGLPPVAGVALGVSTAGSPPGPGSPVLAPERIAADHPDYVLVLPWDLRDEMVEQLSYVRDWGGRLVFPIPTVDVV